jgi:hypothetical protein
MRFRIPFLTSITSAFLDAVGVLSTVFVTHTGTGIVDGIDINGSPFPTAINA